jgi:pyrimidine oxygenase
MALEIGVFLPVTNNGWILSPSADPAPPTFALNLAITKEAERRGMHFVLAQSVWKGHGGATGFWDTSLECFTLMSGLAAATERIGLIASVQPLLYPAPVAAKMVATIDDISPGRIGLNVVAGANLSEFSQMGILPDDWGTIRYDYAREWVHAVTRLWGDEPRVTTEGAYVRLDACISHPKPSARPRPPIVGAGASPPGMAFVADCGTHAFILAPTVEKLAALSRQYKEVAAEQGRKIKTYTVMHYLLGATDEQARAAEQRYREDPDTEAIADLVSQYSKPGAGVSQRENMVESGEHVFFGGVVVGGPARMAEHVAGIADAGLDGLLMMFPDWMPDLARFYDDVVPLLPGVIADPDADWAAPPS